MKNFEGFRKTQPKEREIYAIEKFLYSKDSPVIILEGKLFSDEAGSLFIRIACKNLSDKEIRAAKIYFDVVDVFGESVKDTSEYTYLDLSVEPEGIFGRDIAIPLTAKAARSFSPRVGQIAFSDGTSWESEHSAVWKPLSLPAQLTTRLEKPELIQQYKRQTSQKADYVPEERGNVWFCSCGSVNGNSAVVCSHCGAEKEKIFDLDREALEQNAVVFAQKAEELQRLKEEENARQAEIRKEKRKKRKRMLKIAGILAVALLVLFIVISIVIAATREDLSDDFGEKKSCQLHGLEYYMPKSWEKVEEYESMQKFRRYSDDKIIARVLVYYEGESSMTDVDSAIDRQSDIYSEGAESEFFVSGVDEGKKYSGERRKSDGVLTKVNIYAFECDGSVFSFVFSCDEVYYDDDLFDDIVNAARFSDYENPKILEKITAEYGGETKAGTVIDELSEITVKAHYSTGETIEVDDWTIEKPATLRAEKTSKVKIQYQNKSCTLSVKCTTISENGFKAKCVNYSYDNLARYPEKYCSGYG